MAKGDARTRWNQEELDRLYDIAIPMINAGSPIWKAVRDSQTFCLGGNRQRKIGNIGDVPAKLRRRLEEFMDRRETPPVDEPLPPEPAHQCPDPRDVFRSELVGILVDAARVLLADPNILRLFQPQVVHHGPGDTERLPSPVSERSTKRQPIVLLIGILAKNQSQYLDRYRNILRLKFWCDDGIPKLKSAAMGSDQVFISVDGAGHHSRQVLEKEKIGFRIVRGAQSQMFIAIDAWLEGRH